MGEKHTLKNSNIHYKKDSTYIILFVYTITASIFLKRRSIHSISHIKEHTFLGPISLPSSLTPQ